MPRWVSPWIKSTDFLPVAFQLIEREFPLREQLPVSLLFTILVKPTEIWYVRVYVPVRREHSEGVMFRDEFPMHERRPHGDVCSAHQNMSVHWKHHNLSGFETNFLAWGTIHHNGIIGANEASTRAD